MSIMFDLGIALAAISFMISWLLATAWIDFGKPPHALTWSIAFAVFGISWCLALVSPRAEPPVQLSFALLAVSGVGTALTSLAFRQRRGDFGAWRPIMIGTAAQWLATALLLWRTNSLSIAALPYCLLNAGAAWYAARALIGRRKGERAAERLASYWLSAISALCLILFVYGVAEPFNGDAIPLPQLSDVAPAMPAVLTGVGLFAIFLLTADLADQSRRLAGMDMLTGLLNRRGFEEAAAAILGSARRNNRALCLTVIDIDCFKDVNDRFGHLAGDEVLRRFAACLARHIGPRDLLARMGGEEFALMLADRDCDSAHALLESVRSAVADCPLDLPGDHRITASFGLASLDAAPDLQALLSEADLALYAAKASGRNRVIVSA